MPAMRRILSAGLAVLLFGPVRAADEPLTETRFRQTLGLGTGAKVSYRDLACRAVAFDEFASGMRDPDAHADIERSTDGRETTVTVRKRGTPPCASPYPPIAELPPFDLEDLAGKRVTAANLRGKPTLVNFFFSTCVPCILEVQPLNGFAAARPHMNFLAVTFDDPETARAFARRFDFRWRIVPGARDLIDRVRVKHYPMMALFDARGRLLGTRNGGVRDEFEAAQLDSRLAPWMDSLLRQAEPGPAPK
jgi:cytochrome oxidase Cu insertion factor (SCO1/SenC/PrrC family)